MKNSIFLLLLISGSILAQNGDLSHFAVWKPKEGQIQNFVDGYKRHLKWHEINHDKWSWYGWFITSGPRKGFFMDATFGHSLADFENAVKPAEDRADNLLNVLPFAEFKALFRAGLLAREPGRYSNILQSKYLQLITINVSDIVNGEVIVKKYLASKGNVLKNAGYLLLKPLDAGGESRFILLIGHTKVKSIKNTEKLNKELRAVEEGLHLAIIRSASSETLTYRTDMSYFPMDN